METALSPLPPAFPSNILSLPFYPWSHMECVLNSNFGISLGQTGFFGGFEELSLLVMSTLFQTFRASMERKLDFLIFLSPIELWVCFCGNGDSSWSLTLKVRPWTGLTCCLSGSVVGNLLSRGNTCSCPFLFKCNVMLMRESQGHGGRFLGCQLHWKEQGRKSLSQVTTFSPSS